MASFNWPPVFSDAQITYPLLAPNGTTAAPSYAFASNSSSGIYFNGSSGAISISVSNEDIIAASETSVTISQQILVPNGTTVAPAYAFSSNNSSGLYFNSSSGALSFSVSNEDIITASETAVTIPNTPLDLYAASNQLVFQPSGTGHSFTVTAATPGQNTTLTLPDPGAAAANFLLSQGAQTIAGAQTFSGGALFATSGGTATNLNYYEEGSFTANFNQGAGASGTNTSATVHFTRVGKMVTIQFPAINTITIGTTASNLATASSTVPSRLVPATQLYGTYLCQTGTAGGTLQFGLWNLQTNGSIVLYKDATTTSNWTATNTNNGPFAFSAAYTIQ